MHACPQETLSNTRKNYLIRTSKINNFNVQKFQNSDKQLQILSEQAF